MKSCLECRLFPKCTDRNKSFSYSCSSFKKIKGVTSGSILEMFEPGSGHDQVDDALPGQIIASAYDNLPESTLTSMYEEQLNNPNPIPPDLKFDDRSLPAFKNVLDWAISEHGANTPPFARQIGMCLHLFAEFCPRCSNEKFLSIYTIPYRASVEKIQENVVCLENGICPKCKVSKTELILNKELNLYTDFAGCLGQRSGKSATVYQYMAPYLISRWLKLQNPTKVLGIMQASILTGTMVGLTHAKAMSLLWNPMMNALTNSSWFQSYHLLLDELAAKYGVEEVYAVKDTFIRYNHRNLHFAPMGPNKRTLRGDNRIFAFIDELGWFYTGGNDDEERERASGVEVHKSLSRSLTTANTALSRKIRSDHRYANLPMAYFGAVSSPAHIRDMIMTLVTKNKDSKDTLAVHLPSWQFNPAYHSRDDFAKDYADNPVLAERDFGANPPDAINPFISDVSICERLFTGVNNVQYVYKTESPPESSMQHGMTRYKWAVPTFHTNTNIPPSILVLDAGEKDNSFSLCVMSREPSMNPNVKTARIKVSAFVEIAPQKGVETINFNKLYLELIKPIIKSMNVSVVMADRWQSTKILQDIEQDFKISVMKYSLRYQDMTGVRSFLIADDSPIVLPKCEIPFNKIRESSESNYPHCFQYKPLAHLYLQLATIRDFPRMVEKGDGLTDDNWRALALGLHFMTDEEWCKKNIKGTSKRGTGGLGVVGGSTGGSAGTRSGKLGAVSSRGGA